MSKKKKKENAGSRNASTDIANVDMSTQPVELQIRHAAVTTQPEELEIQRYSSTGSSTEPLITNHLSPTSRGIVIIALGSPQYGRLAANLASSIRYKDKDINIHLVHTAQSVSHLTEKHKALFSSFAECPPQYYTKNDKAVYLKAKTCIYELSPFDETLMLDADMIWFGSKSATNLFDELKDVDFTIQNRNYFDLGSDKLDEKYSDWCNIKEVKEKYNTTGRFYHLHSEFIFFKRSESNKQFFDLTRQIFDNPQVKPLKFDNDIPDELAFDIAVAITGKHPHQDNYLPVFWFAMDHKAAFKDLAKTYYGYSIGGNILPTNVARHYDQMAGFYAKELGLSFHYKVYSKRKWNPGRKDR